MISHYFKGKTIWITGASSGIGASLCKTLSQYGCTLIISSRDLVALEFVRSSLSFPENCFIYPLDISSKDQILPTIGEVLSKHDHIDILINNAGVSQRDLALNTHIDVDQNIMNINFFGTITMTKGIAPSMIKRGEGQIVVISSVTGKVGTPYRSTYAASKHALHGFFDSFRSETEKLGIFTTIICPGYIRTNISINALKGDGSKQNSMDENTNKGMDPMELVVKILKATAKKKNEVYFGGKEILIIYIKNYLPSLYYKIIKNVKP